jgi:hypothetical protein
VVLGEYLPAFLVTLAVEVPIYAAVLTAVLGVGWRRAVGIGCAVNLVTHPLAWWFLRRLTGAAYPYFLVAVEAAVCLVEWLLLAAWTRGAPRPRRMAILAALSLTANAASTLTGLVLLAAP